MMLTVSMLLFGAVLFALVALNKPLRRLPLTPALLYLVVGWLAGAALGAPTVKQWSHDASLLAIGSELAVLMSLFAVGLRLRLPPSLKRWKVALLMAGPGVVVAILLGMGTAVAVLDLSWPAALLLAAIMAPTDPVLASEVQIRADDDRDAVRLSLTAEGALNDGSVLPAVMLAMGLLGLHDLGQGGVWHDWRWWVMDLVWPIGGGALLGFALGWLLGHALRWLNARGDPLDRDELLYVGAVMLSCGLARVTLTSTFVLVFVAGAMLLQPLRRADQTDGEQCLAERLCEFGERIERLVEAATVLIVGLALHGARLSWDMLAYAAVLVFLVRPLSVLAVVRKADMSATQRQLLAWFGIRGIGTLFYLVLALEMGVKGKFAELLTGTVLTAVALSIVLHGLSSTPMMTAYRRKRITGQLPPAPPA
jgi:NhaP-type Na+/H+ or K+/H+ antiporter